MKACPFCQVENRDDALTCRFCGRDMNPPPAAWDVLPQDDSPEPTQPTRPGVRPRPSPTLPPTPPPGGWVEPDIDQTQPPYPNGATGPTLPGFDPRGTLPADPGYPSGPGSTQAAPGGYPARPGARSYQPPASSGTGAYPSSPGYGSGGYGQPGYGAPGGPPPYPPSGAQIYAQPEPERTSDRHWGILLGILVVLLLCVGSLAVWMFTSTAAGGFNRAGADLATQAAGLFGGGGAQSTPLPSATLLAPSPWPTFTPEPSPTAAPSSTPEASPQPDATRPGGITRYLTSECSAALDHLEAMSKAFTDNPGAPLDAAWRDELSQSVKTVREQCGSLDQASPVPGQMAEAQQNLDLATKEFDEANRLFKEGVEELSPGKVVEAGQHFAEATRYLNQALEALRKIGN